MFRLLINIGSTADIFISKSASRSLRKLRIPSLSVEGQFPGGYATRMRFNETADGGRSRYLLLVTEDTLPREVEKDLVRRLEIGLATRFDRLILAKNQQAARADIDEVYEFCSRLASEVTENKTENAIAQQDSKPSANEISKKNPSLEKEAINEVKEMRTKAKITRSSSIGTTIVYGLTTISLAVAGMSLWRVANLENEFEVRLTERLKEVETEYFQVEVDLENLNLSQRIANLSTTTSDLESTLSSLSNRLVDIEQVLDAEPTVLSQTQILRRLADGAHGIREEWQELHSDLEALSREFASRTSSLHDISNQISIIEEELRKNGAVAETFINRDASISQRIALLTEIRQQEGLVADSVERLSVLIASVSVDPVRRQSEIQNNIETLRTQVDSLANLMEEVPVSSLVPEATDSDVIRAQTFLSRQGFTIEVDGDWGRASRQAASNFLSGYNGPLRNDQIRTQDDVNQMNDDELIANVIWVASQ